MNFYAPDLVQWFFHYLLVFARIGSFCFASPIIGSKLLVARVRLLLAVFLTVIVAPGLATPEIMEGLSLPALLMIAEQVFVGLLMGFVLQILFQVFVIGGQMIAMQMGLGFASMNDPVNGVPVTSLSQFFLMLTFLLYVQMDGHLIMLEMVAHSFTVIPAGIQQFHFSSLQQLIPIMSWMTGAGLLLALPVVTALLIVNIAFGVMSRAAPQLNIFSLGFPMTLLIGMLALYISLSNFASLYRDISQAGFHWLQQLMLQ